MSARRLKLMLADPPLGEGRYTYYHPTMGILYLLGAVQAAFPSIEVECKYLTGIGGLSAHLHQIEEWRPDIYGLSFKSPMARSAYRTINAVKETFPRLEVLAGGSHASTMAEDIMARTAADACFVGECENSIVQMLNSYGAEKPRYQNIPGALYREQGAVVRNEPPPHHPNLDTLAWPAWNLVDPEDYSGALYKKASPYLGVLVSRGCPYQCIFCSEPLWRLFGSSTYRQRSPSAIIEEVERHYSAGVREVRLWCEELNIDNQWLVELMDGIAKLGHSDLYLSSDLRANNLTDEMAAAMARAGLWLAHIGMESASDRTLHGLQKHTSCQQIETACRTLKNQGIRILGYFQFYSAWEEDGVLCWEHSGDCDRTIEWIRSLNDAGLLDYIATAIASPRLDTPLWDIATRHGLHRKPADSAFPYLSEGMNLPGVTRMQVRRTIARSNLLKARMGLRSGRMTFRDLPFYAWRNVQRLLRG